GEPEQDGRSVLSPFQIQDVRSVNSDVTRFGGVGELDAESAVSQGGALGNRVVLVPLRGLRSKEVLALKCADVGECIVPGGCPGDECDLDDLGDALGIESAGAQDVQGVKGNVVPSDLLRDVLPR